MHTSIDTRRITRNGVVATAVTTVAAGLIARLAGRSVVSPLNAASHIVWGDRAAHADRLSVSRTVTGAAINAGACLWWATVYESLGSRQAARGGSASGALARGAATGLFAYLLDYRVIPRRLTPGVELVLPRVGVPAMMIALAIGLSARDVLAGARRRSRLQRVQLAPRRATAEEHAERVLDHALEESFPASDPVAVRVERK